MRIALFEVEDHEKKRFEEKLGKDHELLFFDEPLSEDHIPKLENVEVLVVFIYSRVTKKIAESLPELKLISTMSTGFDHIDVEVCKNCNITVSYVPSYGEITVAEHTFALILSLSRRIVESYEQVKSGYFSPEGFTGFDLYGKTLGVVGVGTIGRHVIQIAKGFGMNVVGYKRSPDPELEKELGIKIMDFDSVLSQSDIVTFHVPYTKETHHMMSEEKFHILKKGAYIINTARGAIVDTRALLQAIEDGRVGGVGLDVVEGEPLLHEEKQLLSREFNKEDLLYVLEERMLLHHPNVIITPHNAFNSREALNRIIDTTIDNIQLFQEGSAQNVVEIH